MIKISIDTDKIILSGKTRIFKTDQFIKKTKNFFSIDNLISHIGDGIICNINKILNESVDYLDSFKTKLVGENSLFKMELSFKFAKDLNLQTMSLNPTDIIFYDYENDTETRLKKDSRILDFLSKNRTFEVEIVKEKKLLSQKEFLKIYLLSNDNGVNFPLLNKEQQSLIEIEDENVLVQGVAGSGKTNICLNKLVNTALREYGGRVLYSTYSKSLLLDIKNKLEIFKHNIHKLNINLKNNKVVFTDNQKIKAIENKLGIWLDITDSNDITTKLDKMEKFIETHIDLFLIEDFAEKYLPKNSYLKVVNENFFVKEYVPNIKNYQLLSKFEKIKYLSYEIIYKEIYGNIFGSVKDNKKNMLNLNEYKDLRKNSFSSFECETIYSIAQDYYNFLIKNNYSDNNILTQKLLSLNIPKYSLVILDEVQDFTQINLRFFKNISRRMFCVGDALQMINPSYFSFALLKNMMFEKDISNVKQLTNNYRNSKKIERIVDGINKINTKQFGVHNFVLASKSIDSEVTSKAFYLNSENYLKFIRENKLINLTFVCSNNEEKERLKKVLPNNEILTISEIKGLERNSVVLCDVLSSNFEKWKSLERYTINRKTSDENSVYRYYFNLFYVGITRARQNLYVMESKKIDLFQDLFKSYFENATSENLLKVLAEENTINTITIEELLERIDEFIKFMQFDNARFVAQRINDLYEQNRQLNKITAYEQCEKDKDYRRLGIRLWQEGFQEEAKTQFRISKDYDLIDLIDACQSGDSQTINGNIIEFLPLVKDNQVALSLIIDTMKNEVLTLKNTQSSIDSKFNTIRRK